MMRTCSSSVNAPAHPIPSPTPTSNHIPAVHSMHSTHSSQYVQQEADDQDVLLQRQCSPPTPLQPSTQNTSLKSQPQLAQHAKRTPRAPIQRCPAPGKPLPPAHPIPVFNPTPKPLITSKARIARTSGARSKMSSTRRMMRTCSSSVSARGGRTNASTHSPTGPSCDWGRWNRTVLRAGWMGGWVGGV